MQQTYDVEIDWHGFQLHPEIPPGGIELSAYFGRRAETMRARVETFASGMGVAMKAPSHAPSTIAPLAATEYARDHGALIPMRDGLMDAYWIDGLDIESSEVLAEIATAADLDGAAVASAAVDPVYLRRVAAARDAAHDNNVTAIPTLLVGDFPVVGCQRWEVYQMVAEKLGLPKRS